MYLPVSINPMGLGPKASALLLAFCLGLLVTYPAIFLAFGCVFFLLTKSGSQDYPFNITRDPIPSTIHQQSGSNQSTVATNDPIAIHQHKTTTHFFDSDSSDIALDSSPSTLARDQSQPDKHELSIATDTESTCLSDSESESESPPSKSDLTIFLDLDRTLIFTDTNDLYDTMPGKMCEVLTFVPCNGNPTATVYKRPHVDFFLRELASRYSTIYIFTAAQQYYADHILDKLDPTGTIFNQRWYNPSTKNASIQHLHQPKTKLILSKNVLSLDVSPPIDTNRFIFVDDQPSYMHYCRENAIHIARFVEPRDTSDKALLTVLDLIDGLDAQDDVRPHLATVFKASDPALYDDFAIFRPKPIC